MFNVMILHGISRNNMLLSSLVPIPKNWKKKSIALDSLVCKVIDNITLENHKYVLTSDLQSGFKAKHSTFHCAFVLHEVIDYYTHNDDSSVFGRITCIR